VGLLMTKGCRKLTTAARQQKNLQKRNGETRQTNEPQLSKKMSVSKSALASAI
jgi:hypothetical protein